MKPPSKKELETATEAWRKTLEAYILLKESHGEFRKVAEGIHLDFAGPGLSEAMQRLFHKRNFTLFLEDLQYQDQTKGGVSQLMPPTSSSAKKKPKFSSTEE